MSSRGQIVNDLLVSLTPIYGRRETKSISALVLESVCGWSRIDCAIRADEPVELSEQQQQRLADAKRELMNCRPVQYVLGECEFCGLRFKVREGVLIPRPETEELIRWIADEGSFKTVLDVGTGSGVIAVSLAHVLGRPSRITAIDVSAEALVVAEENARINGSEVDFAQVDILNPDMSWAEGNRYDLIVSNPPYIPASDKSLMRENVLNYEPHMALFVDDGDPLIFYRVIAAAGQELLESGGWLYFEIYETLADELIGMLVVMGYTDVELRHDINEKPRMIRCRKSL